MAENKKQDYTYLLNDGEFKQGCHKVYVPSAYNYFGHGQYQLRPNGRIYMNGGARPVTAYIATHTGEQK